MSVLRRITLAVLWLGMLGGVLAGRTSQTGSLAFDGGGGGGGNPLPPNALAPVAPTFVEVPGRGPLLVTMTGPVRRLVVLRDRTGRLLDLAVTDARGRALLAVPVEGALLDVPGTDVVGLAVAPGGGLALVIGLPAGP